MWRYGFGLRSTPVGAERVPKGTQHPVGVIRWLLRSSVIITGGSSTGELLIKTNPARDFNSSFKKLLSKSRGYWFESNPPGCGTHTAISASGSMTYNHVFFRVLNLSRRSDPANKDSKLTR